jgi:hypothetical protein
MYYYYNSKNFYIIKLLKFFSILQPDPRGLKSHNNKCVCIKIIKIKLYIYSKFVKSNINI